MEDNPNLTVHDADARPFLRRTDERYDLIIVDAYHQPYVPFYLATREFFRLARERLAPGGIVALNVASVPGRRQPPRRDRRHAHARVRVGRRLAGAPLQQDPARLRRAQRVRPHPAGGRGAGAAAARAAARPSAAACDDEGGAAVDGRPRAGRVGDRPDDRRVRRARRRARRGLPADAAVRLLRADGPLIRVGHRGAARSRPRTRCGRSRRRSTHGVDAIEFDVLDARAGPLVLGHSLAELAPDAGDARRGARLPRGPRRRRPRRPEADDAAGRGRGRARAARRRRAGGRQLVPPAEPAGDRGARAGAPDRLHLPGGPLRRLEAPRDEARDPARHARAPARDRRADPGDDRARRRARR